MSATTTEGRGGRSGMSRGHALDYIFILRPTVMVVAWVFFIWGASLAASRTGLTGPFGMLVPNVWLGLLATTAAIGGGCLLNQIVDVETDAVNDKLFLLPRGIVSMRAARMELGIVWALALAGAAVMGGRFLAIMVVGLVINAPYSAPPVCAKSRFPLDLMWNGLERASRPDPQLSLPFESG